MQNACSTLPARVHCKGAPPSSEKQQRQNLARDAAPIGSNDARPPERDALPDVLQHLLGDLGDERPDERDPVAHHRAAGRVAGVAAVTSQGSVLQGVQMKNGSRRYVLHMSPSDFKVALHESVFRASFVCAVSMALRASHVPVQRTHTLLPPRVLAHLLRQVVLDVGPDALGGPEVHQPARGLRGCVGGTPVMRVLNNCPPTSQSVTAMIVPDDLHKTPTSKSCEVISKCKKWKQPMQHQKQCTKMPNANATPSRC